MNRVFAAGLLSLSVFFLLIFVSMVLCFHSDRKTGSLYLTGGNLLDAPSYQFDPSVVEQIKGAKELLKQAVNTWDPEMMKKARARFLGLLAKEKQESLYLLYYIALCDYRLSCFSLSP